MVLNINLSIQSRRKSERANFIGRSYLSEITKVFFKDMFLFLCMPVRVCVVWVQVTHTYRVRIRHHILWSWSYRYYQPLSWELEPECRFSRREWSTLNQWVISPAPKLLYRQQKEKLNKSQGDDYVPLFMLCQEIDRENMEKQR